MGAEFFTPAPTGSGEVGARQLPSWVRRTHRWISILFLLTVMANFAVRIAGPPPAWITYAPLPPLFLLMGSGLVMLIAPAFKRREGETERRL